jgi:hypothetical protein
VALGVLLAFSAVGLSTGAAVAPWVVASGLLVLAAGGILAAAISDWGWSRVRTGLFEEPAGADPSEERVALLARTPLLRTLALAGGLALVGGGIALAAGRRGSVAAGVKCALFGVALLALWVKARRRAASGGGG